MPDLVVGKEQHPLRLAAQRDRNAKHRAWVQRAVLLGDRRRERFHVRRTGGHDVAADVTADSEGELLGGGRVSAKTALQDQAARLLECEAADLR